MHRLGTFPTSDGMINRNGIVTIGISEIFNVPKIVIRAKQFSRDFDAKNDYW